MTAPRLPQSMDEMLQLTREEALELGELTHAGDVSIKAVTRHMMRLLADEVTWKGRENSQSLRGVWYSGVKQVYQNLFPERWEDGYYSESPSRRFSQELSSHLSEMVKEGELTYRDLNVIDDSRDRRIVGENKIEHDKILFVEKEAKFRQLEPITDVLEVSLVSGGGWQATALIEDMANILDPTETYTFFILTDYDPTGYQIADDFESRAKTLGVNVDRVERIGIEPEQVPDETLENERFEVPVDNETDREWLYEHGLEDEFGEPRFGLELEAIGGRDSAAEDFRRVVVEALESHMRKDRRRERDTNIETANTVGRGVDDLIDELTANLAAALKAYAVEELQDHEAINSLRYAENEDSVYANVDLDERVDSGDDRIPYPLEWGVYQDYAIDPRTDDDGGVVSPRPARGNQVDALQSLLVDEMQDPDGAIDVMDLLEMDG